MAELRCLNVSTMTVLEQDSEIAAKIIKLVWGKYGQYPAAQLSPITHRPGTPWTQVWNDKDYGITPNELIRYHYTDLIAKAA